jgi:hypothetical protein
LKEWWRTACRQFLFMRIQPYKTLKIHSRRIILFLAEFLFHAWLKWASIACGYVYGAEIILYTEYTKICIPLFLNEFLW